MGYNHSFLLRQRLKFWVWLSNCIQPFWVDVLIYPCLLRAIYFWRNLYYTNNLRHLIVPLRLIDIGSGNCFTLNRQWDMFFIKALLIPMILKITVLSKTMYSVLCENNRIELTTCPASLIIADGHTQSYIIVQTFYDRHSQYKLASLKYVAIYCRHQSLSTFYQSMFWDQIWSDTVTSTMSCFYSKHRNVCVLSFTLTHYSHHMVPYVLVDICWDMVLLPDDTKPTSEANADNKIQMNTCRFFSKKILMCTINTQ